MNPADDTASPKTQDNAQGVSGPSDMDLQAINQAIAESANEAVQQQNSFDVNDISLDNTPTSDAELQAQMAKDPNMSLAGANAPATAAADLPPAAAAAPNPEKPSQAAGFVDGDLQDEPSSAAKPAADDTDYSARGADPVDSFDENSPALPTDLDEAKPEGEEAKDGESKDDADADAADGDADSKEEGSEKDDKKKPAKKKESKKNISIDFDKIIHSNVAIVAIVVVVVVVLVGIAIALAFT